MAARNVLVQTPSCVKITDFGLAKLLNHDSHKYIAAGGKMPIKWLAIECIRKREFTSKSDVWAFAVTIWEILTFGQKPYENIAAKELPDLIEQGLKLYQPECCSLDIYMKLVSCWHLDSNLRPTFKELVNIFADFARDPGGFLHIPGDKFTRLPASTSRAADISATEDYLQPKPDNVGINEDISEDQPHLNRYCKDPINKTSSGEGDETDSNLREIGVGNLRLDLPVDEDDYLMPTCQKNKGSTSSVNNLNNNNNLSTNANANAGYMDLIAGAPSIDNPEYLLNANSTGSNTARILQGASITSNPDNELVQTPPIPTQTLGIPVIKAAGSNPAGLDVEQQNSDHEYYNDLQRELQPLRKNGNETRV
uniref:Protein kinase domain-containing protein n=1 Tax=Megaselia scalaris TaxID=36166 RepID=T1GZA1_MEGSC